VRTRTLWAVDYGIGCQTDRGTSTASALRLRSHSGRATRRAAALKRMCSLAALRSLQCRKLHRRCTLIAARVFSSLKRLVLRTQSKILRREKKPGRLRRIKRASRPRRRSRCVGQTFPNDSKCTTVFQIWTCRTHSDVHRFCMRMTRIPFMDPMQIHLRRSSAPWNYWMKRAAGQKNEFMLRSHVNSVKSALRAVLHVNSVNSASRAVPGRR